MRFLAVRVPQKNEYTHEQVLGFLSSIGARNRKKPFFGFLSKSVSPEIYTLNILSFEQNIHFILGSQDSDYEYLKNQILAQYGKADLRELNNFEEIANINYQDIELAELVPSRSTYLPIKTAGDSESDPLVSVLSTMSRSADPGAIFWVEIVLIPEGSNWQMNILNRINKINAAESKTQGMQNEVALLQEKIKHPGFRAYIRIAADAKHNLQALYNSFNAFAQPSGNHFAMKAPNMLNEKKLRLATQTHSPYGSSMILNNLEISTIWHLPNSEMGIPNIVWGKRLQLDPPENLPIAKEGMSDDEKKGVTFLGRTMYKNRPAIFGIKNVDRLRHLYIVGKTGTGKSWFIDNMAIEDIRKGNGVAVLDPHGDAIDTIMDYIPKNRLNDVCYFNPADPEYAYPLNILEVENHSQKELMVSGIIAIFYKLYSYSWGPRLEHILRNVLFTLVNYPNSTLVDIIKILNNKNFREKVLSQIQDPIIQQFWKKEFGGMSERFADEAVSPILNKVGQFVTSPLIRKIIEHPKSKVKIEELMNNKKIFLCDLSQGKIGEDNATLLGSMIITKIQIAAMNRAFISEDERVPFYMYVDEFQNFATQSFTKILSEARKYKLGLTLANQYITQIDPDVMNAILGNVGTITCFNVGAKDADILYKEFGATIEAEDLTTLDTHQMLIRLMIDKVTTTPFTYYSLPLPKNVSGHKEKIIEQSRARYGIKIK